MARILVVDDDKDILRLVEKVLGLSGHTVVGAESAMRAMDLLNSTMFDLMISDANMPHLSGFDLVRQIRSNRRFASMGIAMMTGLRERKDIEKAIRAGVDDYIVKPIDPTVLNQKVVELFFKKPPMESMELQLSANSRISKGCVSLDIQFLSISEFGMLLRSSVEIPTGLNLQLDGDIFEKIQISPPEMKVVRCKRQQEFQYDIRVDFVGLNENTKELIRAWVHSQNGRKVAA